MIKSSQRRTPQLDETQSGNPLTHTHTHNQEICGVSESLKDRVLLVLTSAHPALTNTTQGEEIRRKQSSRDETSPQEGRKKRKDTGREGGEADKQNESEEQTIQKQ